MQENIKLPTESELKAAAESYHALGLSIIPFKLTKKGNEYDKLNLSSWKKWETEPQTNEEFRSLNWNGANAFAIILGTQAKNGLYLSVIDYDCKGTDVTDEVKDKGRMLLKEFPITCMEQTINKGIHLIYWTRTKPKTIGTYHNTASLELLGEKKLCLMAPSLGYSKLNDNSPTETTNIEQTFLSVMKKHGFLKEQKQPTAQPAHSRKSTLNRPRPCIIEALKLQLTGPNGHLMRLAVAAEYKRLGYTNEEIMDLFRNQTDFDFSTCQAQIESIDAEKTAKCESIKEYGYCLPTCTIETSETQKKQRRSRSKDEDENKPVSSPGMSTSDLIFEQVYSEENGNHYIIWDRIERKFRAPSDVWRMYTIGENDYYPLSKLAWPSATTCSNYGSEETLYSEIRAFIMDHLDVPNDLYYDVYTCFAMATWRAEDFKVVPYIFFLGPMASGKTRGLECFNHLCYRPILAASISAASLFRVLEAWHPTLLLDETEIYNKENMAEVLSLLNSGYRKGQCALRIKGTEQGNPEIATFDVFGFKALAGTQELADTLQSRCIITAMSKAVRQLNIFIDEAKAQELRNKLLTYRFLNLGNADDNMIVNFLQENQGFRNARVIELFISLLQVAPTAEVKQRLLDLMKQITQTRLDAEQASIEARIFEAILKSEGKVNGGKISTQIITELFNDGLSEKDQSTSRFIGRKVSALGFEKCRVGDKGQAGFFYDATLIKRLKARYFPNGSQLTSETTETSETSVSMGKQSLTGYLNTEVSEDKLQVKNSQASDNSPLNTVVSEVTEETEVKIENTDQTQTTPEKAISIKPKVTGPLKVNYRLLAPNEPHPCDGTYRGSPCPHEAKYLIGESNYYCESHFQASKADCEKNGYSVMEMRPENQTAGPKNCRDCSREKTDFCNTCYDFDNFKDNQTTLAESIRREAA